MKKIILPLIIFSFLFAAPVFAEEANLPDPGLTPDSPFYFLETITEEIVTFFTFGDLKKAERYAALAAERLAEAQVVMKKESFDKAQDKKAKLTEKTMERYERQLNKSITRAEKAREKGKNTEKVMEVVARVGLATSKHLEILAEVYEKVPEQAKTAIENAMKSSLKGHERAVEALKARNVLGEVPEAISLPANVPQQVREKVRTRVQQELMIDKVLRDIDPSESLRDLCTKKGGPPEQCEKLPAKVFKSFKQIEAYCTELGGPPEICASVEAKCKEVGVTKPRECFLVLMTASVTTGARVAPALSEEEMEQRTLQMEAEKAPLGAQEMRQKQMEAERAAAEAKIKRKTADEE